MEYLMSSRRSWGNPGHRVKRSEERSQRRSMRLIVWFVFLRSTFPGPNLIYSFVIGMLHLGVWRFPFEVGGVKLVEPRWRV